jgi:undecaprenyl diphosphate synthase
MHVAIIMDGNGRWATRRGLPRVAGHRAGVGTVRRMVEHAPNLGIRRMTLYAFSSDNWRRPAQEVQSIFRLMRAYLRIETEKLRQRGVQLQIIGRRDRLPKLLLREIERAEFLTADGKCLHLRIAVDYSSREAIIRAIGTFSQRLSQEPESSVDSRQNLLSAALSSEN